MAIKKNEQKISGLSVKANQPPGTMVFIGRRKVDNVSVDLIHYTNSELKEINNATRDQIDAFTRLSGVNWINVVGVHDIDLISRLTRLFSLHPLTMEDIVNTQHRPKVEEFPSYIFVIMRIIFFNETTERLSTENVSLIIGENYVLSFQERKSDIFNTVLSRIRTAKGHIRTMKADYLAYGLIDAMIDQYYGAVEQIGEDIEDFDDRIMADPQVEDIQEIHRRKRDILTLRKAIWPLREEIGALKRTGNPLVQDETKIFFRDLYDHAIQLLDMVETFRDTLGSIHDTYLSCTNNRMNEVMKVLTIISTIFIPLSFIAGVYGMNFSNMPELKTDHGYYLIWSIMIVIAVGMLIYFRKKKWL